MSTQPKIQARLLKIVVQPIFVMDDGTTIEEATGQPITVAAKDWQAFTANAFGPDELAEIAKQYAVQQKPQ
ncbi:MAG: hypothetical protein JWM00_208 [Candidatus Saccharibacteria bacterium]|nr:hypothetical protein [Candidatus Saccharibacteria bacterium]